jgi:hypothetical protein
MPREPTLSSGRSLRPDHRPNASESDRLMPGTVGGEPGTVRRSRVRVGLDRSRTDSPPRPPTGLARLGSDPSRPIRLRPNGVQPDAPMDSGGRFIPWDQAVNHLPILGPGPAAPVTVPAGPVERGSPGARRVADAGPPPFGAGL